MYLRILAPNNHVFQIFVPNKHPISMCPRSLVSNINIYLRILVPNKQQTSDVAHSGSSTQIAP